MRLYRDLGWEWVYNVWIQPHTELIISRFGNGIIEYPSKEIKEELEG